MVSSPWFVSCASYLIHMRWKPSLDLIWLVIKNSSKLSGTSMSSGTQGLLKGKHRPSLWNLSPTFKPGDFTRVSDRSSKGGKASLAHVLQLWHKETPIPYISNDNFRQEDRFRYWHDELPRHGHVNFIWKTAWYSQEKHYGQDAGNYKKKLRTSPHALDDEVENSV